MKLNQLLAETPAEVSAISNMAIAIVQYLHGIIATNVQPDMDWDDPSYEVNMGRGIQRDQYRRPLNLSPAVKDDWAYEVSSGVYKMLKGQAKKHMFQTTQYEVGTVGEILSHMNYKATGLSNEQLAYINKTWLILTDRSDNLGVSHSEANPGPHQLDQEDYDTNQRIELSGPHFIKANRTKLKNLASILAHELTHALDAHKSDDKMHTKRDGTLKGVDKHGNQIRGDEYWKLQYEVNARYTQLAGEIEYMVRRDPKLKDPTAYEALTKRLMRKHKLIPPFVSTAQQTQIMKRLFKHMNQ